MLNLFQHLKYITITFLAACVIALSLYTVSCTDNPTELGLKFIPPGETTGVRIFDSYIDTMQITSTNIKKHINTSSSSNLIIGQSGTYNSKGLIKFPNLNPNYDSATVLEAVLKLRYKNYYFPFSTADSLGQISFDVYKVQANLTYSQVTLDSITSTTFGTTSKGSYTGSPAADSEEVDITLDPTLVKDWLEYQADTSYPVKNYGVGLIPNAFSAALKGFHSANGGDLRPVLYYIVNKNGDIDTVNDNTSQTVFLADANLQASEEFFLQAGISYLQVMKFDVSRLPSGATINDVQLILTLDSSMSIFTNQTNKSLNANYILDTAGLVTESLFDGSPSSSNQYTFRLVSFQYPSPFQRWLNGQTNYGLLISPDNNLVNLDRFVFYDVNSNIPNTRPRVIIKYTPRITDEVKKNVNPEATQ
jgi:hypothetical protein